MNKLNFLKWGIPLFLLGGLSTVEGYAFQCTNEKGDHCFVEAEKGEDVSALIFRAANAFGKQPKSLVMEVGPDVDARMNLWSWDAWNKVENSASPAKKYQEELSSQELDDMRFFVMSIAYKPIEDVVADRRALENALNRLEGVHPLRFIAACIEDLQLRNAMHKIREDKWLWRNFFGKVKKNLNIELKKGSLDSDVIQIFSLSLDLDIEKISTYVESKKWDTLADLLFEQYPAVV